MEAGQISEGSGLLRQSVGGSVAPALIKKVQAQRSCEDYMGV